MFIMYVLKVVWLAGSKIMHANSAVKYQIHIVYNLITRIDAYNITLLSVELSLFHCFGCEIRILSVPT